MLPGIGGYMSMHEINAMGASILTAKKQFELFAFSPPIVLSAIRDHGPTATADGGHRGVGDWRVYFCNGAGRAPPRAALGFGGGVQGR